VSKESDKERDNLYNRGNESNEYARLEWHEMAKFEFPTAVTTVRSSPPKHTDGSPVASSSFSSSQHRHQSPVS